MATWFPRDVASRAAKERCDAGYGVGPTGSRSLSRLQVCTEETGENAITGKYGNLFDMYRTITGSDPLKGPMMIYPAVTIPWGTMGQL
jgi:succinate dehydrogenase / fumarate reductase flavoprotein subunit